MSSDKNDTKNNIVLAVVGSRYFNDYKFVSEKLEELMLELEEKGKHIIRIVSGGAPGVDTLAEQWAEEMDLSCTVHHAQWNVHGKKRAGPIRNQLIVDDADMMIAFPLSNSSGTRDSIRKATSKKIPVRIHRIAA